VNAIDESHFSRKPLRIIPRHQNFKRVASERLSDLDFNAHFPVQ